MLNYIFSALFFIKLQIAYFYNAADVFIRCLKLCMMIISSMLCKFILVPVTMTQLSKPQESFQCHLLKVIGWAFSLLLSGS